MPRGTGKEPSGSKCRCVICSTLDENAGLTDESFTNVMQSVWGPVEVDALVTTEESRASSSQAEQDLAASVTEWVQRISEKKNENLRNYWVDNQLPPDAQ